MPKIRIKYDLEDANFKILDQMQIAIELPKYEPSIDTRINIKAIVQSTTDMFLNSAQLQNFAIDNSKNGDAQ